MVRGVKAVRGQREHARKRSGAHSNHQQQAYAKPAYSCGQDKRADAKRGTDLPDELLTGRRATHASNRHAILHHHSERRGEQSHPSA